MEASSSLMISNTPFSLIEKGHIFTAFRRLTSDDVLHFAKVSGDTNPLHLDAQFAQEHGFASVTAHSMWVPVLKRLSASVIMSMTRA